MKVFLSWSGNQSHQLAQAFKDWLPSVFQSVKPFFSSKDINAGVQWFPKLKGELETADFGIVCLTRSNLSAPYIMLESGAMAMRVDAAKLVPVLCDVPETELGKNPLTAFNYVHLSKEGIFKLAESINVSLGESRLENLEKTFEKWWPDLEEKIKGIIETPDEHAPKKKVNLEDSVEEMLSLLRSLARREEGEKLYSWPLPRDKINSLLLASLVTPGADRIYNPDMYPGWDASKATGKDLKGSKPEDE